MDHEYWSCPDCGYTLKSQKAQSELGTCPACDVPLEPGFLAGSRELWWWGIAFVAILVWFVPLFAAFVRWVKQW